MAPSMFGGHVFDPLEFGSMWDPLLGLDKSVASCDAHIITKLQIDWCETPKVHIFIADLSGMKKKEVKLRVLEGKTLEISRERKRGVAEGRYLALHKTSERRTLVNSDFVDQRLGA